MIPGTPFNNWQINETKGRIWERYLTLTHLPFFGSEGKTARAAAAVPKTASLGSVGDRMNGPDNLVPRIEHSHSKSENECYDLAVIR